MSLRSISLFVCLGVAAAALPTFASAQYMCDSWTFQGRSYQTCYGATDSIISWETARAHCTSLGAGWDLIDINGQSEQNEAERHVVTSRLRRNTLGPWIGYNDRRTEGTWVNLQSQPLCYSHWGPGEPNDLAGEDCAQLFAEGFTPGPYTWNDYNCAGMPNPTGGINSFMCEQGSELDPNCGCVRDEQCSGERFRCRAETGQCVACLSDMDCMADAPICDPTTFECIADNDRDGVPDEDDLDDDNDGIPDTVEAQGGDADADEDGDGRPNRIDLDADGDGIADITEAGGTDTDRNGLVDGFIDLNGDGLDDRVAATPLPTPDTDSDTAPDFLDLDADGDGITDALEGGALDTNGDGRPEGLGPNPDANEDGLADALTGGGALPLPNTDMQGPPDYQDLDSDADGIPDAIEGHDQNGDGIADRDPMGRDADNDGIDDAFDPDAGGMAAPTPDHDFDGKPDFQDPDDDMDGRPTIEECPNGPPGCPGDGMMPDYLVPATGTEDSDGDGLLDTVECATGDPTNPDSCPDSDGDGFPDLLDIDDDNDGILTATEILGMRDTDGDTIPDYLDLDSDRDGIPDIVEALGTDADADGRVDDPTDVDRDGLRDSVDPDQGGSPHQLPDTDGDGMRDFQDTDSDADTILDEVEGHDVDGNGLGDVQRSGADANRDGIDDAFGGRPPALPDHDSDGLPDYRDPDDDQDGRPTATEMPDPNRDGYANDAADVDGDGILDYLDPTVNAPPPMMTIPDAGPPPPMGNPGFAGGAGGCSAAPAQSAPVWWLLGLMVPVALRRRRR